MCGIYTPDSGTAHVLDIDMHSFEATQQSSSSSIGFCPQQNILYDSLTVRQHLKLIARIKGFKCKRKIDTEVKRICALIGLDSVNDVNKCASQLSGGMKRRLCVGMALVGESRVILLDEPTSGLDPYNRRCLWDIIRKCKSNRTIILTTHYMEEADALADRLVLLHHGKVKCCGTPLFLKETYGAGYRLILTKEEKEQRFDWSQFQRVWNEILSKCECNEKSSVQIESHSFIHNEICVRFASPRVTMTQLSRVLEQVEERKSELAIRNYGISSSTVEDVFLK
jgi:ATP-binding cassette, subfamily A (ABC1), member 3